MACVAEDQPLLKLVDRTLAEPQRARRDMGILELQEVHPAQGCGVLILLASCNAQLFDLQEVGKLGQLVE